ncbi:MAG: molybdenum cofactor guanylyltransferase [Planctomycetales bacterium]
MMEKSACGGIVVCGGKSSRMGVSKAMLPFGPERMLQRVVRVLSQEVDPIVVVAAAGQELPDLPLEVQVVRDRREGAGPLEGIAVGLAALQDRAEAAYVSGCDVPLLSPDFVRRVIDFARGHDVAVPKTDGYHHPLAAVYRMTVLRRAERLLAENRMRPVFLYESVDARILGAEELSPVDPGLQSLRNVNRPEDYLAALSECGHVAEAEILAQLKNAE